MKTKTVLVSAVFMSILLFAALLLVPQNVLNVQIPTSQPCNNSEVNVANAEVFILCRQLTSPTNPSQNRTGVFTVNGAAKFNPATMSYPIMSTNFRINVSLTDSTSGTFNCTTIEQLARWGKTNPTIWLSGHCQGPHLDGCRYWLMIVGSIEGPDPRLFKIISFIIFNKEGNPIAYGTGPVRRGNVRISYL